MELDSDGVGFVEFTVKPQEAGRFAWEVRIPVAPTDAAPQNNRYPVVLRVVPRVSVRQDVSLLHIEHRHDVEMQNAKEQPETATGAARRLSLAFSVTIRCL